MDFRVVTAEIEKDSDEGRSQVCFHPDLGFGLVGIDRYLITPLFPIIANDLHLGYGDIGTIAGALAIAWSIAALLMGNLSDRIGRRPGCLVGG